MTAPLLSCRVFRHYFYFCFLTTLVRFSFAKFSFENNANEIINNSTEGISGEALKQVMWKRCSNSNYLICAKLALVHVIEKLDISDSYSLLPGISLIQHAEKITSARKDNTSNGAGLGEEVILGVDRDFNEALDNYLLTKIRKYLGSLTLSVKLLDKNTVEDVRSFGEGIIGSPSVETGRGKKKMYMHSLMMAGWMSGATLLALTMKTIALLSGKALLAALLSLMLSVVSAFSKGHHEPKSTTYEIITKPIVSHSHTSDIHEGHPSEHAPSFAYRRSLDLENVFGGSKTTLPIAMPSNTQDTPTHPIPDNVDRVIYRIHSDRAPFYIAPPLTET